MNLSSLEPQFVRFVSPGRYQDVNGLHEAHGIRFLCPKCYAANGGGIGTHSILLWFKGKGVPDSEDPKPGRWMIIGGTGYANLSLAPSIQLSTGCQWHGFITNGSVT